MSELFPTGADNRGLSIHRGVGPGTLLVSTPGINSDYFQQTVILITERNSTGHLGFVLNKQTIAEVRTALVQHGMEWPYQDFMYEGGPVQRSAMIMMHSQDWYSSNTMQVSDICAISSDKLMFEKMIDFNMPAQRKFLFGQCVWTQGQLDREISHHRSWLTLPATEQLVWDTEGEDQWHAAIELCAKSAIDHYFE